MYATNFGLFHKRNHPFLPRGKPPLNSKKYKGTGHLFDNGYGLTTVPPCGVGV